MDDKRNIPEKSLIIPATQHSNVTSPKTREKYIHVNTTKEVTEKENEEE